jgi:hypothetical protein
MQRPIGQEPPWNTCHTYADFPEKKVVAAAKRLQSQNLKFGLTIKNQGLPAKRKKRR